MTWFFLGLLAPVFWAISNIIDKWLISGFFDQKSIGSLLLLSTFIALPFLPVLAFFIEGILSTPLNVALIMLGVGVLRVLTLFPYFRALSLEEASVAIPILQSVPVFTVVLAYLCLGETVSQAQLIGGGLIILGSVIISIEIEEGASFRFNLQVLLLMLLASFLFALSDVIYKFAVVESSFWVVIWWEYLGSLLTGLALAVVPRYRRECFECFRDSGRALVALNLANEVVAVLGNLVFRYAQILTAIALVSALGASQPVFVLFLAVIASRYFPKVFDEQLERRHLARKALAISAICSGAVMLVY